MSIIFIYLIVALKAMKAQISLSAGGAFVAQFEAISYWYQQAIEAQTNDVEVSKIK